MHPASLSIKVFGVYVVLTGIGLLLAPGLALAPLGIAAPTEIWARVLGALAIVLGYYYWSCGVAGAQAFFEASVKGRLLFTALCVLLIVAFGAPWQLLLFGAVDVAGAAWTWRGLRMPAQA
jgi:hypothetical protein